MRQSNCAPAPDVQGEPVGRVKTVGGYPDDSEHTVEWLCKYKDLKDGDLLYAAPAPADVTLTNEGDIGQVADSDAELARLVEALERIANMDSMSYHSLDSAKITARAAIDAVRRFR